VLDLDRSQQCTPLRIGKTDEHSVLSWMRKRWPSELCHDLPISESLDTLHPLLASPLALTSCLLLVLVR
jgi:hypothetical protein